ncbi:MAG: hypothetical protein Q9190_006206 [Brigantiaea leucoxantha]
MLVATHINLDPFTTRRVLDQIYGHVLQKARQKGDVAFLDHNDDPLISDSRLYPKVSFSMHSQRLSSTSNQRLTYFVVEKVLDGLRKYVVGRSNYRMIAMGVYQGSVELGKGILEAGHRPYGTGDISEGVQLEEEAASSPAISLPTALSSRDSKPLSSSSTNQSSNQDTFDTYLIRLNSQSSWLTLHVSRTVRLDPAAMRLTIYSVQRQLWRRIQQMHSPDEFLEPRDEPIRSNNLYHRQVSLLLGSEWVAPGSRLRLTYRLAEDVLANLVLYLLNQEKFRMTNIEVEYNGSRVGRGSVSVGPGSKEGEDDVGSVKGDLVS